MREASQEQLQPPIQIVTPSARIRHRDHPRLSPWHAKPRTPAAFPQPAKVVLIGLPDVNRSHRPHAGAPREPNAAVPRRQPPANRTGASSNPCRSRSPYRPAAFPKVDRSAARTGCQSVHPDYRWEVVCPSGAAEEAAGAGRSRARNRRKAEVEHTPPIPFQPPRAAPSGALSHRGRQHIHALLS